MYGGIPRQRRLTRLKSFTLVELLVVIAIIAILAALTLMAGQGVMTKAGRSRAQTEIQGMSASLESYKADNAIYPVADTFANGTNDYKAADGSTLGGVYQLSSQALYQALTGQVNFQTPVPGAKSYFTFKANQVGNTAAGDNTYVQDPFGYSYGYYTGDNATPQVYPPNNGTGFFDLWSTGGVLANSLGGNPNLVNTWIANWH